MTEEQVTLSIIEWLKKQGFTLIAFDFPQSGTGVSLKPVNGRCTKNKAVVIPDIIAHNNEYLILFENKNRFYLPDFVKVETLRNPVGAYAPALAEFRQKYMLQKALAGIGLPRDPIRNIHQAMWHISKLDFLVSVTKDKEVIVECDQNNIFTY